MAGTLVVTKKRELYLHPSAVLMPYPYRRLLSSLFALSACLLTPPSLPPFQFFR